MIAICRKALSSPSLLWSSTISRRGSNATGRIAISVRREQKKTLRGAASWGLGRPGGRWRSVGRGSWGDDRPDAPDTTGTGRAKDPRSQFRLSSLCYGWSAATLNSKIDARTLFKPAKTGAVDSLMHSTPRDSRRSYSQLDTPFYTIMSKPTSNHLRAKWFDQKSAVCFPKKASHPPFAMGG